MLVHQIHETEGIGNDNVKLLSIELFRLSVSGPTSSGIRLGSNGVLSYYQSNGGLSAISGQWLIFGDPSTFYVQRTILNGTLETDPGAGFLQLNTNRDYINLMALMGLKTTEVFFEISDDISGVPVIETATMTFNSEITGTV